MNKDAHKILIEDIVGLLDEMHVPGSVKHQTSYLAGYYRAILDVVYVMNDMSEETE